MNTTTNTNGKTKRPYRKTGKYSKAKAKPRSRTNPSRIVEAGSILLSLTPTEREIVIGLFN